MTPMKLTDYKVLTFDCYGTLIDWEAGIYSALQPLLAKAATPLSKDAVLETFARHESAQEAETPRMLYSDVLAAMHRRLADDWGLAASDADHRLFGDSVPDWPAFPDSAEALAYLKQHYKLVILSNVDNAVFAASNVRLGVVFDAVYTAEDIGSYKPADGNFLYMTELLEERGYGKGDILHTAESLFHDHEPANRHGLHSCRIFRRRGQQGSGAAMNPAGQPRYDFCFDTMGDMAKAHARETSERG